MFYGNMCRIALACNVPIIIGSPFEQCSTTLPPPLLLLLQIDAAIAGGFGMPMGPFRLSDLVGRCVHILCDGQHPCPLHILFAPRV
jgi:hypothetical protein